jgi:xanthine dehydrogenase YagS FAD-binding subunit
VINFEIIRPSSVKAALEAIDKSPNSRFIAGGTNLVDLMKRGVTAPEKLIDISRLPLGAIEETGSGLRIGALALNSDIAAHPAVRTRFPLLARALEAGASPQIRNMATAGGNLMQRTRCPYFYEAVLPCNKRQPGSGCSALGGYNRMHAVLGASEQCIAVHPSDMAVALAALDATVVVNGLKGTRRIPILQFHRLPGRTPEVDNTLQRNELITAIELPASPFTKVHYEKVRDRASYAFALVSVAAALQLEGSLIRRARLALGGVAHKPWRATAAEAYLAGKPATVNHFREAGRLAFAEAKGYGHNDFKLKLGPATIELALQKCAQSS